MATKIAINGFGRIGRCVTRALFERELKDIELVAINDLTNPATLAHLFQYDSVHRTFKKYPVRSSDKEIFIGDKKIQILAVKEPSSLPWKDLGVDIVLECTGLFTEKEKAQAHLQAGAKKVIISAPAKNPDITLVMGVNHHLYDSQKHSIVSNGSCTTNCLAPIAKVMLDVPHRKGDLRRARAAASNMIPTSTGAAKALAEVIPALKGKLDGLAVRVPTMDVSLVDLTLKTEKPISKEAIHKAMKDASENGHLAKILYYTEVELVSGDYIGCSASSVFDATMTQVLGDKFAKIFAWYDNEWGFSERMIDLSLLMTSKGL